MSEAQDSPDGSDGGLLKLVSCSNCRKCLKGKTTENGWPVLLSRMVLCPNCGDKRCPKADDHRSLCTGSAERVYVHNDQMLALRPPAANAAIRMSAETRMLIGMAKEHVDVVKAAQTLFDAKGLMAEATQMGLLAKTFDDILACLQATDRALPAQQQDVMVSSEWQPHIDRVLGLAVERRCEQLMQINETLEAEIDRLESEAQKPSPELPLPSDWKQRARQIVAARLGTQGRSIYGPLDQATKATSLLSDMLASQEPPVVKPQGVVETVAPCMLKPPKEKD